MSANPKKYLSMARQQNLKQLDYIWKPVSQRIDASFDQQMQNLDEHIRKYTFMQDGKRIEYELLTSAFVQARKPNVMQEAQNLTDEDSAQIEELYLQFVNGKVQGFDAPLVEIGS